MDPTFRVPVPIHEGKSLLGRVFGDDSPESLVFEVRTDAVRIAECAGGYPRNLSPDKIGLPLAGVNVLQPGTVSGASDKANFKVATIAGYRGRVAINDGPAVWLKLGLDDWIIPTPRPQELAREIDRRRRRVVRYGGFASDFVFTKLPELWSDLPLHDAPHKPCLTSFTWTSMPVLPPGEPSPPATQREPRPWHDVSGYLPDLPGDVPGALLTYRPDLGRNDVADTVPFVIGRSGLSFPRSFNPQEGDRKPFSMQWPYVRLIEAGYLRGVPPGTANVWRLDGDLVPSQANIVDGPAVWLWGHLGEFLLCVDDAESVAAAMELRRATYLAHGNDDQAWFHFPDSKPDGPFTPSPPAYAPAAPTLVPPQCWRAFR